MKNCSLFPSNLYKRKDIYVIIYNSKVENFFFTFFAGTWTSEAKKIFSKSNCAAKLLSEKYVNANPIRQELLEKALIWFAGKDDKLICAYMGKHQHDKNANELWLYFQSVIAWVKATFVVYRKEMKGIEWGTPRRKNYVRVIFSSHENFQAKMQAK